MLKQMLHNGQVRFIILMSEHIAVLQDHAIAMENVLPNTLGG